MKKLIKINRVMVIAVGMAQLVFCSPLFALTSDKATILNVSGEAHYMKAGSSQWTPLDTGMVLLEGDSVKTGSASEAVIELSGAFKTAEITVREDSEFNFQTFQHDPEANIDTTLLDVELGAVLVKAEKLVGDSKFEVKTPTSIVGIRGTTFEVQVSKNQ